ncbi:DUF1211 domain-containing protein [Paenibacillus macerans]|uniref:DUF1211 domain-containing protein n=1 Tax=Paenibacillus macerans TaxID=44252 RepID=UPI001D1312FB|nr:DUF1211 domain-containing protein [Paenibacillus macerans]MBS5910130.1 hypothetical protein [Paenibacillus macerans]MEC0331741.1 hypothetical protein [Paenibacillus macerans]UMV48659.1 DUF1211 domain-containing protein [Paenibacillus macerans]
MSNRLKEREKREKVNPLKANRMEAFSDGVLAIIITIIWFLPDKRIEHALRSR